MSKVINHTGRNSHLQTNSQNQLLVKNSSGVEVFGSDDGTLSGTQKQLRVDGNGRLSVDINSGIPTKTDGTSGHSPATGVGLIGFDGGTANAVHTDSQGALKVKNIASVNVLPANNLNSGITNDPADSVAVGLRARQTITDASTETFLKCNSDGELLTSATGGDASASNQTTMITKLTNIDTATSSIQSNVSNSSNQTTMITHLSEIEGAVETIEACVSSNKVAVSNNNSTISTLPQLAVANSTQGIKSGIINTDGYSKVLVICANATNLNTSVSVNAEFSDHATFSGGLDLIYNSDDASVGHFTPVSFQSALSADGLNALAQAVIKLTPPAQYMRIGVFNTSGGAIDVDFFYILSN